MEERNGPELVICVDNRDYPMDLALHKLYRVIPDESEAPSGCVRIVDETGEDYLYPAAYFAPLDRCRLARCVRNDGYPASLDVGGTYLVLPDATGAELGLLRVIDESGESYLFSAEFFAITGTPTPADIERIIIPPLSS